MATRKREGARMGGPPIPPESLRRNRVVVMLTDSERTVLERVASSEGVPVGTAVYRIVSRALRRK